ncbi:LemA family protein [uncultured Veillonella sp.]|jgi:LemA family protein|uniref:LemA family protein n=1 Tax=uncultured Veillonella sp. TaxID=159268 RepID=UPI0028DAF8FC|nr:LemA family protein [uncultured Veillonella sp.]
MLSTLIFFLIVFLIYFFIKQYNLLQNLTVEIKEARANIIVAYEKKVAIVNQFTGLVNEYGDYEKLIQLKVSDNFVEMARETSKAVQNITALANQFPDLKANTQYGKFLEAISENETFISNKREIYNYAVKQYNSAIAQIPMVFVASLLGFKQAPFFDPNNEGALAEFSGADPEAIKELALKGRDKLKETTDKVSESFEKREQEAQAKREERIRQEREAANNESVTTEEKTEPEAPKAEEASAPVEKQEEK